MEEKSRRRTRAGEEREGEAKQDGGEEADGGDEVWGEVVQQFKHRDCVEGRFGGGGGGEKRWEEKPQ